MKKKNKLTEKQLQAILKASMLLDKQPVPTKDRTFYLFGGKKLWGSIGSEK